MQLSAVAFDPYSKVMLDKFDEYIDPGRDLVEYWSEAAMDVHKIRLLSSDTTTGEVGGVSSRMIWQWLSSRKLSLWTGLESLRRSLVYHHGPGATSSHVIVGTASSVNMDTSRNQTLLPEELTLLLQYK